MDRAGKGGTQKVEKLGKGKTYRKKELEKNSDDF